MFKKIKSWFLKIIGDVKVFKYPMWIVYDPVLYQINGTNLRTILKTVRIGDILVRGYCHYLDGFFIPGKYSHSGIYIGDGKVIHAVAEGVKVVDILDFMQADRAGIIRLKSQDPSMIKTAIERAKSYIGTKYDYFFTEGDDAFYCHELTATCYKECGIQKEIATAMGGLLKKKDPVYLASSFINNANFEVVLEV